MQEAFALDARRAGRRRARRPHWRARVGAPTLRQCALAALSSLLLVLSFPDFELWPLAWVGLVPLLLAVFAQPRPRVTAAFLLGWLAGTLFFYGSCWWLTHSMIHYGGLPAWLAFPLLAPPTLIVGLFPAAWCFFLARAAARWGRRALLLAPPLWAALEWARLSATGQLWNALGYSQAYHPSLIQPARWGGVYAVSFLLVAANAAAAFLLLRRSARAALTSLLAAAAIAFIFKLTPTASAPAAEPQRTGTLVVAVQPNVPISFERTPAETAALISRHISLSAGALREWDEQWDAKERATTAAGISSVHALAQRSAPRVVVWPESPMNFSYADDAEFRAFVGDFARQRHASVLFNSLEPAPAGGAYNSAVMVDERGRLVAQYDKIRLLPFGEYVPLPRWLGGGLLGGLVGQFTPGAKYPLMPFGDARVGVFICFESAFPEIARTFTREGADALVNISNDGYLGRTPVLRQHLANAVFRAVENGRAVLRVTNTGISALITPEGEVRQATDSFAPAVRTWTVWRTPGKQTFYTRHGELFVVLCAAFSVLFFVSSQLSLVRARRRRTEDDEFRSQTNDGR